MPDAGPLCLFLLSLLIVSRASSSPVLSLPLLRHGAVVAPTVARWTKPKGSDVKDSRLWRLPTLTYLVVSLGTPPQPFLLQVDTGSSDLVLPSASCDGCLGPRGFHCNASATCRPLYRGHRRRRREFNVTYGDGGSASGPVIRDRLSLAPGGDGSSHLTALVYVDLMARTTRPGLFASKGYDGIFGLGPDTATGSHRPSPVSMIFRQNGLANVFAMYAGSDLGPGAGAGTLTLGGTDRRAYRGAIQYVPMVRDRCHIWEYCLSVSGLIIGDRRVSLDAHAFGVTLLDSGTTLTLLPPAVFASVRHHFKTHHGHLPHVSDPAGDTLFDQSCFESPGFPENFPVLTFRLSRGVVVRVPPEAYLIRVPSQTNATVSFCLGFAPILGRPNNPDTLLGGSFMAASYVVFDRDRRRIGFARPSEVPLGRQNASSERPVRGSGPATNGSLLVLVLILLLAVFAMSAFPLRKPPRAEALGSKYGATA